MNNKTFFENYFQSMNLHTKEVNINHLDLCLEIIQSCKETNNKIILVGNGGSASIASHLAVDFTKAANVRSITFNESSLITCFANDYGYKNWVSKALEFYAKKGDVVILISSSGTSKNIVEGAKKAKEMGIKTITFSGFLNSNILKSLGDINFWVDSKHYNFIEMTHHIWLVSLVDKLVELNNKKKM